MRFATLTVVAALAVLPVRADIELGGRVVDAVTERPIAFANVSVDGAPIGTVADEKGRFRLSVPEATEGLAVSATGYRSRQVPLQDGEKTIELRLEPRTSAISETITVTAPAGDDDLLLGKLYKKKGFAVGFGSGQLGSQIGAHIRVRERTFVKTAHFVVEHTGGERFLYRLNLYDFADGAVGENLVREDVIIEAPQQKGPIEVDLTQHRIVVEDDVLLCLEWIKADNGAGNSNVMFRARRSGGSLYMRMTSHSAFEPMRSMGLGFYLIGAPLPPRD